MWPFTARKKKTHTLRELTFVREVKVRFAEESERILYARLVKRENVVYRYIDDVLFDPVSSGNGIMAFTACDGIRWRIPYANVKYFQLGDIVRTVTTFEVED